MRWLEMQMQSNAAQLNLGVFSNAAWPGVCVAQFNTKEIKGTKNNKRFALLALFYHEVRRQSPR
jgi:hypothetical protein